MSFLNPLWFFGLLSLGIPILIHLIHQNQGKVFKVGSISLFENIPDKNQSFRNLQDLFLFLVRCFLLIILIFILSEWVLPTSSKKKTNPWILLPRNNPGEVYHQFKKTIDSLVLLGAELHFLDSSFSKSPGIQNILNPQDSISSYLYPGQNYLDRAEKLEYLLPKGSKAFFFTDNLKSHFTGSKPLITYPLIWRWFSSPKTDTTEQLVKAWQINSEKIYALNGISREDGIQYYPLNFKKGEIFYPYILKSNPGDIKLVYSPSKSKPLKNEIRVDTGVLSIAIISEKNSKDAIYLESAIRSGIAYFHQETRVFNFENAGEIRKNYSWIFYLKSTFPPSNLLNYTKNLFEYVPGNPMKVSGILRGGDLQKNLFGPENIALYQSIATQPDPASEIPVQNPKLRFHSLWEDEMGNRILEQESDSLLTVFKFYTHFDPNWNDLVWSDSFPRWIMKLISQSRDPLFKALPDRRGISGFNGFSYRPGLDTQSHLPSSTLKSLTQYLAFLFLLLTLLERVLSHKTP